MVCIDCMLPETQCTFPCLLWCHLFCFVFLLLHHLSFAHLSLPSIFLSNSKPPIIFKVLSAACSICSGEKQLRRNPFSRTIPNLLWPAGVSGFYHSIFGELSEGLSFVLNKIAGVGTGMCSTHIHTETHITERMREKNIKVPSLLSRARICCHGNPPTPSPKNHQEEVMASRRDWLNPFFIFFRKRPFYSKNRPWDPLPLSCIALLGL